MNPNVAWCFLMHERWGFAGTRTAATRSDALRGEAHLPAQNFIETGPDTFGDKAGPLMLADARDVDARTSTQLTAEMMTGKELLSVDDWQKIDRDKPHQTSVHSEMRYSVFQLAFLDTINLRGDATRPH